MKTRKKLKAFAVILIMSFAFIFNNFEIVSKPATIFSNELQQKENNTFFSNVISFPGVLITKVYSILKN